ncbi:hypothetical protein JTE90_024243 [Oedothorax gibbosus]|uniref:Uncharacterized protein n=1 Tax=Oedothorax gibbosus TaxID=931172 RepID=A0AAV6TX20_9ARAC|nr:hypothetical protein JTE90_024243 [Oedothorax gibbosus]
MYYFSSENEDRKFESSKKEDRNKKVNYIIVDKGPNDKKHFSSKEKIESSSRARENGKRKVKTESSSRAIENGKRKVIFIMWIRSTMLISLFVIENSKVQVQAWEDLKDCKVILIMWIKGTMIKNIFPQRKRQSSSRAIENGKRKVIFISVDKKHNDNITFRHRRSQKVQDKQGRT